MHFQDVKKRVQGEQSEGQIQGMKDLTAIPASMIKTNNKGEQIKT